MDNSTNLFYREWKKQPSKSRLGFLHGYIYARWIYLYIAVISGEHWLGRVIGGLTRLAGKFSSPSRIQKPTGIKKSISFADTYHGKVLPLKSAIELVTVNQEIKLTVPERVIPYTQARDIILNHPDHIALLDCPCRSAREHPCQPLDVCIIVGEPFVSMILQYHPRRARKITPGQAVTVLKQEDDRGHVHHAFFKDAMLGRYYAICNCCSCCCGALQAHQHGTPMLASSGYLSQVDEDLCIGCGICSESCQFKALSLHDGCITVDQTVCMGCGVCITKCDQGALSLRLEPSRGYPLEMKNLLETGNESE